VRSQKRAAVAPVPKPGMAKPVNSPDSHRSQRSDVSEGSIHESWLSLGAASVPKQQSSQDDSEREFASEPPVVSLADDAYEVTGELDHDVGVGGESAAARADGDDDDIVMVDASVQTEYVPGFGEVAPEVNAENVLRLLNRARRNPKSMAALLDKRMEKIDVHNRILKADGVFLQLAEGRKGVEDCIRVMRLAAPVPELELSEELCKAAQEHVADMGPKGLTGHTGSDGSTTWDRVARHCEWRRACAENIDYMSTSAPEIVLSMLVDDDVPSRGHRKTILKSDFTKVGIAYGPHKDFGTLCVLVFAGWVGPKMKIGTRKAMAKGKMTKELKELLDSTPFGADFGAQAAQRLRTGGTAQAELKWDGKKGELKVQLVHEGVKGRTTRTLKGQWKS
jgi:hypothetical protein